MNPRKIVKKVIPAHAFQAVEPYGHLAESVFLNVVHGFPGRGMKVIGVTGTNGKTSTCYMIHRMLCHAGYKTGLMTTVAYGVGDDIRPQIKHMTNVPVPEFMRRLKWMRSQGVEWLVLETTSHALAQNRTWGVPYSIAVMTNVTHEHLDYHKTFERYTAAKRRLFERVNANRKGLRLGVINADDPQADYFAAAIAHPVMYGIDAGDVRASNVQLTSSGVEYDVPIGGQMAHIRCNVPGSFSVYNSLAAVCAGQAVGLEPAQIAEGIAALDGVEGRMTRIDEGQPFSVVIDFAHTPDSFEKLFKDLRPVVRGKLIVLFGSAGRRDQAKRGAQGKLAGQYADVVVLTEEDDRDIDGQLIMDQIAAGAEESGKQRDHDLFLVHDRTEAIEFALKQAGPDDMVLLLGKGHEKTIERADGEHPWDEVATARAVLRSL
ncbi:hypothetical protein CR970_02430 [Candidatus Saccharibacteria bacterium]|nr:MAG: hypothetical protein CR970_02430 [Candidatus Saccharibacteria bacterium]